MQINKVLEQQGYPNPVNQIGLHTTPKPEDFQVNIAGGLVLKRDYSGHFRGIAYINGMKAEFLIDTGATFTTIPKEIAVDAGLPIGRDAELNTANGVMLGHHTQIEKMVLGSAEFENVNAIIADNLNMVLIGMNVLKHFTMTVEDDTMTLTMKGQTVVNDDQTDEFGQTYQPVYVPVPAFAQPYYEGSPSTSLPTAIIEKPAHNTWKKSVLCDNKGHCVQSYTAN